MPVWVAGRQVYVNTQRSQTVKICTTLNKRGQYERYYRIIPPNVFPQQQIELTISRFETLEDLEHWLVSDRRAKREKQNEVGGSGVNDEPAEQEVHEVVAEVLDLISSSYYSPDQDSWLQKAKKIVEECIDQFVQEFVEHPYLHRVEHSIHTQLFHIMMSQQELAQRVTLGNGLAMTQLVHKEWPESISRKGNRRGNFDMVVLAPDLLKGCPSIRAFHEGHLEAPIVIEMGLNYNATHLAGDAKKLMNSKPKHGYLIHLVRDLQREAVAEQIILGIQAKYGIKTAYVWTACGKVAVKLVNEQIIKE